jgi:hypothetical protein
VTRISRRRIEHGLRLPAPAPGAELGRRIKDQIPDDLFGAPEETSRRDRISGPPPATGAGQPRTWGRPAVWAVAASVVVALGAGWLATRMFETADPLSPAPIVAAPAESESAPAAAVDQLAPLEVGETESVAQASSSRERSERRAAVIAKQSTPPRESSPAREPAVAAPAARPDSAVAGAATGGAAPAPDETDGGRGAAFDDRERLDLAPASLPAERPMARQTQSLDPGQVAAKRALAKPARDSARLERVMDDLLETAADRAGSESTSAISIDGTSGRTAGRLVLLVSATVRDGLASGNAERMAAAIELELEPTLVKGYRLLASHARDLGADTAPTGVAARAAATRRVTALYELEIAGDLDRNTGLGTVRLRDNGKAKDVEESTGRGIVAADFAHWATTTVSLRLTALGAEIALLPGDAPPEVVASLRAELERLRAGADVDEVSARRADELLDVLSR